MMFEYFLEMLGPVPDQAGNRRFRRKPAASRPIGWQQICLGSAKYDAFLQMHVQPLFVDKAIQLCANAAIARGVPARSFQEVFQSRHSGFAGGMESCNSEIS